MILNYFILLLTLILFFTKNTRAIVYIYLVLLPTSNIIPTTSNLFGIFGYDEILSFAIIII